MGARSRRPRRGRDTPLHPWTATAPALGFDCELTSAVASSVSIPVIASGGAGNAEHFIEVFSTGRADAALAASIFHFGTHAVADLKQTLLRAGISMRWPC